MIKVKELAQGSLPQEFIDCLPKTCECGADMEINETLTVLHCSNKKCPDKIVQRLLAMLNDLGVKNLGESKCGKVLQHFGTDNPYFIFAYEEDSDGELFEGCTPEFSQDIQEQVEAKSQMQLWEYVRIGNIPGIRDSARHLFKDYTDLEVFYEDLEDEESGGVQFVQRLLGIKGNTKVALSDEDVDEAFNDMEVGLYKYMKQEGKSDDDIKQYLRNQMLASASEDDEDSGLSVRAIEMYKNLMFYKSDLLEYIEFVDIVKVDKSLNICISTAVGDPFKSKTEFVDYLNQTYGDKIRINFLKSVTKDCQYLVWSGKGDATSKVVKARKYIETGACDIEIVTGQQLVDIVENM